MEGDVASDPPFGARFRLVFSPSNCCPAVGVRQAWTGCAQSSRQEGEVPLMEGGDSGYCIHLTRRQEPRFFSTHYIRGTHETQDGPEPLPPARRSTGRCAD